MILLDTNVASEMLKPQPHDAVVAWMTRVSPEDIALAATTAAELLYGAEILPTGARRSDLIARIRRLLRALPVLPFDHEAAHHYATVATLRRTVGRPISTFDCQIAATARAANASVATRDVGGFADCGVEIINPWDG